MMTDEMDEIWALYADDGAQALDAMEEVLEALAKDADGADAQAHIGALFRAVHTFKGNSRVLGLGNVEGLAHLAEDLIGLVRDEGAALTPDIVDSLMRAGDMLRAMLEETADTRADVDPAPSAALKDDLRATIAGLTAPQSSADPSENEAARSAESRGDEMAEGHGEVGAEAAAPTDPQPGAALDERGAEPQASGADAAPDATSGAPDTAPTPPATPGQRGLDPALAGLLDQLDGGDGADFDDFMDDDDPTSDGAPNGPDAGDSPGDGADEAPEQAAEDTFAREAPEATRDAMQDAPVQTIAEVGDGKPRDVDPMYKRIFSEMAEKTRGALGALIGAWDEDAPTIARKEADALAYAARQMGLPDWADPLAVFAENAALDQAETQELCGTLDVLIARDFGDAGSVGGAEAVREESAPKDIGGLEAAVSEAAPEVAPEAGEKAKPRINPDKDALAAPDDAIATSALSGASPMPEATAHAEHPDRPAADAAPCEDNPAPGIAVPDANAAPHERVFFAEMAALYPEIAALGMASDGPDAGAAGSWSALIDRITALADPHGYVRLIDAARQLGRTGAAQEHRAAELAFYEELVTIERSIDPAIFDADLLAPSRVIAAWCADHVFDTLGDLRRGLDRNGASGAWFPEFEALMRRVHFACLNYRIESAAQLTMALIDLFARGRAEGVAPDVILLQMGRGYIDTMELVFDALAQGDAPDIARIEKMFEDASNACFVASGVVTAKHIGTRLGLPPEFHRVMSPESVKAAHDAMAEDFGFFVLRADLNDDDALAQEFLDWITTGLVRMITNVTVFDGARTLFDFLVAAPLSGQAMTENLAELDPSGLRLALMSELTVTDAAEPPAAREGDDEEASPADGAAAPAALLEAVGSISASHALLEHELSRLASDDLMQGITDALRAAGAPSLDLQVRSVLRTQLEDHSRRLQAISEAGAQLTAELSHLQQETAAQRSRPAEALLRPLQAYVATRLGDGGAEAQARVTYAGGDVVLDQVLIDDLRGILKALVNLRLAAPHAPTRFHVSVETENDHVRIDVTDNGPTKGAVEGMDDLGADLRRRKGALRVVTLPAGAGMRFHIRMPQNMVVLDGMVVRIGRVRYVLPIDAIQRILQSDRLLPVAASGGLRMLNMGDDGLVPVQPLGSTGLDMGAEAGTGAASRLYVIVQSGGRRIAIPVDELLGQQLVMLRPLEGVLSEVRHMSGIAILSGGEVGMIVSVGAIAADAQEAAWAS